MHDSREPHASAAESRQESASPPEALPGLLRRSLQRVLVERRYLDSDEAKLRTTLRDVCARARRDAVRAEHLLIVLKELWRDLPERARLPRYAADEVLSRVVSACITEYYEVRTFDESDLPSHRMHESDEMHALPPNGEMQ